MSSKGIGIWMAGEEGKGDILERFSKCSNTAGRGRKRKPLPSHLLWG